MAQDKEEQSIADILGSLGSKMTKNQHKEAPFENFTMYTSKDIYIGNFSMPDNFSEVTKASVLALFASKNLKLLKPGATKKDITLDDLE